MYFFVTNNKINLSRNKYTIYYTQVQKMHKSKNFTSQGEKYPKKIVKIMGTNWALEIVALYSQA